MYLVIESTPGYLPESDDPFITCDYTDAVRYANELANELEENDYQCDRSWASADNYYAIKCTMSDDDLGRVIEVVRGDES